jgi:DNA helicase-2/ATP-dependent DNA helicase PcrA
MEDWAACVRTNFGHLFDSCLSTLDEAWSEDPVTPIKLDGNTFKAPAKSTGKRVADSLVVGASRTHKIAVSTIHSVKGKTFEAVLLVSSPTKSGGKGGHWQEWLQDQKSEPARFAFVASSRPSRLLAWAIPLSKNLKQDFEKITGLGFAPVDLSEWKTVKKRKSPRSPEGQDRLF